LLMPRTSAISFGIIMPHELPILLAFAWMSILPPV
jgi:hypothetical protein